MTDAAAQVQLPRLSIPTFSGDALLGEPFGGSFDVAVHTNTSLTNVQKLIYHNHREVQPKLFQGSHSLDETKRTLLHF